MLSHLPVLTEMELYLECIAFPDSYPWIQYLLLVKVMVASATEKPLHLNKSFCN